MIWNRPSIFHSLDDKDIQCPVKRIVGLASDEAAHGFI